MIDRYSNWEKRCPVCLDIVSNPICLECLGNEIVQWIAFFRSDLIEHIQLISMNTHRSGKGTQCVICGGEVDTCFYCFKKEMEVFISLNCPELVEEYCVFFRYGGSFKMAPAVLN